jgi:hypothetical protein
VNEAFIIGRILIRLCLILQTLRVDTLNLWSLHTYVGALDANSHIFLHLQRCDFTVDDIQIVNAAAHGASAITLSPEMTDDLKSQVDLCKKHGIEPLVMIKSVEDGALSIISD